MSSHYAAPVPSSHLQTENAKEELMQLYISDDASLGEEGVIPGSFKRLSEDVIRFKYGKMEGLEVPEVRGSRTVLKCNKKSVILVGDMLVVERANKDLRESIIDLFERRFTSGINLDTVEFEQGALRTALNNSKRLVKSKYTPSDYDEPDYVVAKDRDELRQTEFHDGYGEEEIDQLKLITDETDSSRKISFSSDGRVTINERNLSVSEQVSVFRQIYPLITEMVDMWGGAQRKASGWSAESDE
jgi:hypothetical protein